MSLRVVTCQACGFLALRAATVMECARLAVEHAERIGCDAEHALVHSIEVGRER